MDDDRQRHDTGQPDGSRILDDAARGLGGLWDRWLAGVPGASAAWLQHMLSEPFEQWERDQVNEQAARFRRLRGELAAAHFAEWRAALPDVIARTANGRRLWLQSIDDLLDGLESSAPKGGNEAENQGSPR